MIFGNPITNAKTIAYRIAAEIGLRVPLREDRKEFIRADLAWNDALMGIVRDLGTECGCETHCLKPGGDRESVFDLIWLSEGGLLTLAAEIEWASTLGGVRNDFAKLLYAKSPLKLMILARPDPEGTILPALAKSVVEYAGHVEGEEYVIIQLSNRAHRSQHRRLHACRFLVPKTDGTLTPGTVSFTPIDGSPFYWTYPPGFGDGISITQPGKRESAGVRGERAPFSGADLVTATAKTEAQTARALKPANTVAALTCRVYRPLACSKVELVTAHRHLEKSKEHDYGE